MSDIKELGESLLTRAKQRNDERYKRSRRDAFQIGIATAGAGILNNVLKQRTSDFLNSEEMLSQRAKQLAGYTDAQAFIRQQEVIDASGMDAASYFTEQNYAQAKAEADLHIRNSGMNEMSADKYNAFVREMAAEMSADRVKNHQEGYEAARNVASPQDFARFQQMSAARTGSNASVVTNGIRRLFGGKSRRELESDTISSIENSSLLKDAENVSAIRNVYNSTGNLNIATKVADAIADGTIEQGKGEPILFRPVGTGETTTGPGGETYHTIPYNRVDSNGNVIAGEDGRPMVIRDTTLVGKGNISTGSFSTYLDNLTPGQVATQTQVLSDTLLSTTPKTQELFDKYTELLGGDSSSSVEIQAATASIIESEFGLDDIESSKLASSLFLDKLHQGWDEGGMFSSGNFNFAGVNMDPRPTPADLLLAIGALEGTPKAINFSGETIGKMTEGLVEQLSTFPKGAQEGYLSNLAADKDIYSFMFAPGPENTTAFDVIVESLGLEYAEEVEAPTNVVEDDLPQVPQGPVSMRAGQDARQTVDTFTDIDNHKEAFKFLGRQAINFINSPVNLFRQTGDALGNFVQPRLDNFIEGFNSKELSDSPQKSETVGAGLQRVVNGDDVPSAQDIVPREELEDTAESLLIKRFEGEFQSDAFSDGPQHSIGYGTKANSPDEVITQEEAQVRLNERVQEDKSYVERFADQNGYDWNEDQVSALTSFIYNLGKGALAQVTENGTRDNETIADKMLLYVNASGRRLPGLVRRRQEEHKIFTR